MDKNNEYVEVLGNNDSKHLQSFFVSDLPTNIINEIDKEVNILKKNFNKAKPHNKFLAGEIKHEYTLKLPNNVQTYIANCIERYTKISDYLVLKNFSEVVGLDRHPLDKIRKGITFAFNEPSWINFQKKNEYNPIHSHEGFFSWVIWHKIPFTMEEEANFKSYKSNTDMISPLPSLNGLFQFHHNNRGITFPTDTNWEGKLCIFPSNLHHSVNPFYSSDDYRITLSGNISIKYFDITKLYE